jgi:hypothetical protein
MTTACDGTASFSNYTKLCPRVEALYHSFVQAVCTNVGALDWKH